MILNPWISDSTNFSCVECVDILLQHGCDMNQTDFFDKSPLVVALYNSKWSVSRKLVQISSVIPELDEVLLKNIPPSGELIFYGIKQ